MATIPWDRPQCICVTHSAPRAARSGSMRQALEVSTDNLPGLGRSLGWCRGSPTPVLEITMSPHRKRLGGIGFDGIFSASESITLA